MITMQNNAISTLFVGRQIIHLPTVASTNVFAQELLANSAPIHEGTIVWTDFQSAGKGQQGSVWKTEAGQNLTASFIFYPTFLPAAQQFYWNKAVCLALYRCLERFDVSVRIKWPNDIYVGDKKLAGVLIENQVQGNFLKNSVVGIGINVNQDAFDPALPNPSSIRLETGQFLSLEELLYALAKELEVAYLHLKSGKKQQLDEAYEQLLFRFQEEALFASNGQTFRGKIIGTTEQGQLRIDCPEGIQTFDLKEVSFLI